jgi:DNA-binding ferritin-like protein
VKALLTILFSLKALESIHQVGHWQSKGASSYSDHQLFERMYTSTSEEVDAVAEKALGLQLGKYLTPHMLTEGTGAFLRAKGVQQVLDVEGALRAERAFISLLQSSMAALEPEFKDSWSMKGLDNLLAGIMDNHEKHVYLLQQRVEA